MPIISETQESNSSWYIRTVNWWTSVLLIFFASVGMAKPDTIKVSPYLDIVKLSPHTYLHISYINYQSAQIACNGLVFISNGEAAVFDTPVGNEASMNLLQWIYEEQNAVVTYFVANHFHEDCISGLSSFVGTGCATISHKKTCKLAGLKGYNCTQRYFADSLEFSVGDKKVECHYFGPAHTTDNIVAYIPSERMLFGGCMVKSIGSDKGNLADADLEQWPATLEKVMGRYPKVKTVIPGHGAPGNKKLLKYTLKLFSA